MHVHGEVEIKGAETSNGRLKVDVEAVTIEGDVIVSDVEISSVDGAAMEADGKYMPVKLTGSIAILAGEPKPAGNQNDTLLEYDTSTGETKVYKYISGDWREL